MSVEKLKQKNNKKEPVITQNVLDALWLKQQIVRDFEQRYGPWPPKIPPECFFCGKRVSKEMQPRIDPMNPTAVQYECLPCGAIRTLHIPMPSTVWIQSLKRKRREDLNKLNKLKTES